MKQNIKVLSNSNKGIISPLPKSFLASCKQSFVTRHVDKSVVKTIIAGRLRPKAGDLMVARVKSIKKHGRIELLSGRRSRLFKDDLVILSYGDRYAPDQFESIVPADLSSCHMVAGGGIASLMINKSPLVKPATEIVPIGLLGDSNGNRLNLSMFTRKTHLASNNLIQQFFSVGSSMNSGKTTTAAHLVHGFVKDGFKVAALKITGTGSGCDLWHFKDAGAHISLDFTDAGFASTYKVKKQQLIEIYQHLYGLVASQYVDVIITEIADGILQQETDFLLNSDTIKSDATAMFYSASDSCAAVYGVERLSNIGYQIAGVSGVVSANPLNNRETVDNIDQRIPVITKEEMLQPGFSLALMDKYTQNSRIVKSALVN